MKLAILIQGLSWSLPNSSIELDRGITLNLLSSSLVQAKYEELCYLKNEDFGDPLAYEVYVEIDTNLASKYFIDYYPSRHESSITTVLPNLITIIKCGTLGTIRIIASDSNYQNIDYSFTQVFIESDSMVDLWSNDSIVDSDFFQRLVTIWTNVKIYYYKESSKGTRISNALSFFYLSWNAINIFKTTIFTSIVLEALFSPNSNSELTHQIAYNFSKFQSDDKEDQMRLYKLFKKFYALRSSIVHGDNANYDKIERELTPEVFKETCRALNKILIDSNLVKVFENNQSRTQFFLGRLF